MADDKTHKNPEPAIANILKDMGVESYDDGVVPMLLGFLRRQANNLANDAEMITTHDGQDLATEDDVKLAIRMRREYEFTQPPGVDVCVQLDKEINKQPLPDLSKPGKSATILLPPQEDCLTTHNYELIVDPNRPPRPKQQPRYKPRQPISGVAKYRASGVKNTGQIQRKQQKLSCKHIHSAPKRADLPSTKKSAQEAARAAPSSSLQRDCKSLHITDPVAIARYEKIKAQISSNCSRITKPSIGTYPPRKGLRLERIPESSQKTVSDIGMRSVVERSMSRVADRRAAIASSQSYAGASTNLVQSVTPIWNSQKPIPSAERSTSPASPSASLISLQSAGIPRTVPGLGTGPNDPRARLSSPQFNANARRIGQDELHTVADISVGGSSVSNAGPSNLNLRQTISQAGPSASVDELAQEELSPNKSRSTAAVDEIGQSFVTQDGDSSSFFDELADLYAGNQIAQSNQQAERRAQHHAAQKQTPILKKQQLQDALKARGTTINEARFNALLMANLRRITNARRQTLARDATQRATNGDWEAEGTSNGRIKVAGNSQDGSAGMAQRQRSANIQRETVITDSVEAQVDAQLQALRNTQQMTAACKDRQRIINVPERRRAAALNSQGQATPVVQQVTASHQGQSVLMGKLQALIHNQAIRQNALLNILRRTTLSRQQRAACTAEWQRIANVRRAAMQRRAVLMDQDQATRNPKTLANMPESANMAHQQTPTERARTLHRMVVQQGRRRPRSVQTLPLPSNVPQRTTSAHGVLSNGGQQRLALKESMRTARAATSAQVASAMPQRRSQKRLRPAQCGPSPKRQSLGASNAVPPPLETVDSDGARALEMARSAAESAQPARRRARNHSGPKSGESGGMYPRKGHES